MKKIATIVIETMFMLTLFAAGWFALVVFQLLTNPIPHGNIGYKMRNKEVVMELGTKIIGDFGGYTELWNGEVVTIETFDVGPREKEVKVKWDNGSTTWIYASEIDANKGIGYFTEDGYYG